MRVVSLFMIGLLAVVTVHFALTTNAIAGERGVLINGRTIITHKDGKAVELADEDRQLIERHHEGRKGGGRNADHNRTPASQRTYEGTLSVEQDSTAKCYILNNNISCVRN